jgi:hypothetical protein
MWSAHFQIMLSSLWRVVADSPRHDILNLGWNVLVVNPSDVKRGDKERYQKQML